MTGPAKTATPPKYLSNTFCLYAWAETTGGQGDNPPTFGVGGYSILYPPTFKKKCFGAQDLGCLGVRIGERE
jgi:hypothetical protein